MKLIVIEGLDGAGKSTQIKLLQDFFKERELKYKYLHFPRTDAPFFGELIAKFLRGDLGKLGEISPYLVALIYAGDRKDISDEMYGWLNDGNYVLLDRYAYSNIAYQCAKLSDHSERQKLKEWIRALEFTHFGIPEPAINIFLDVPFSFTESNLAKSRTGEDRSYLNGNSDIHESNLEFQKAVREVYIETAISDPNVVIIDCHDDEDNMLKPEEVFEKLLIELVKKEIFK
jgi:dTMP kinase